MKKKLLAIILTFASTALSAATLSVIPDDSKFNRIKNDNFGDKVWGGDGSTLQAGLYEKNSEHQTGTLISNIDGYFTATYLGKAGGSQYAAMVLNYSSFPVQTQLLYTGAFGNDSIGLKSVPIRILKDEVIPFSFYDGTSYGGFADMIANGDANTAIEGILYLDATPWNAKYNTDFAFLVGYNDKNGPTPNYDDVVMGVSAEVPLPAALPLMASALGIFGIARRNNKAKAV